MARKNIGALINVLASCRENKLNIKKTRAMAAISIISFQVYTSFLSFAACLMALRALPASSMVAAR